SSYSGHFGRVKPTAGQILTAESHCDDSRVLTAHRCVSVPELNGFRALGRCDLRAVNRLDRGYQPISSLVDGLNKSWFSGVIFKDTAELGNTPAQHGLADECIRPDRLQQGFLG